VAVQTPGPSPHEAQATQTPSGVTAFGRGVTAA